MERLFILFLNGETINKKKNRETLLGTCKEGGLPGKKHTETYVTFKVPHQNAGQNYNVTTTNKVHILGNNSNKIKTAFMKKLRAD
jgi:hypothetical protein